MVTSQPSRELASPRSWKSRVVCHLPAWLYGWFWLGMCLCGLLAPADRVAELNSSLIREGWHLSVLALALGGPILVAYWLRMSGRWRGRDRADG